MRKSFRYPLVFIVLLGLFSLCVDYSPLSFLRLRKWRIPEHLQKDRSFVFIIPSYNCSDVCEKTLRSIFTQTYENFRVIYIDDGSTDHTYETAKECKERLGQDQRLEIVHCPERKGAVERLYEKGISCEDSQIIIYMKGNAWLKDSHALAKLNDLYKKHAIWTAYEGGKNVRTKKKSSSLTFRSRGLFSPLLRRASTGGPRFKTFYASLFKKVKLEDFFFRGSFVDDTHDSGYFFPLLEMSGSHSLALHSSFCEYVQKDDFDAERPSRKASYKCHQRIRSSTPYTALASLPTTPASSEKTADLLIFSYDRPLQAFALLESISQNLTGMRAIFLLYRTSSERFAKAYEELKRQFPQVHFIAQSEKPAEDFQTLTLQAVFEGPSEYIVFSVDDMIVRDKVDIKECIQAMEKTGAYFFSLRLGKHINYCYMGKFFTDIPRFIEFDQGLLGWQLDASQGDWMYPNSIDLHLYRKKDLQQILKNTSFHHPTELEILWSRYPISLKEARKRIRLCYSTSKALNIPMNLVHVSKNANMNLFSPQELLEKFESGFKMSIAPLRELENSAVHVEHVPTFITRKAI